MTESETINPLQNARASLRTARRGGGGGGGGKAGDLDTRQTPTKTPTRTPPNKSPGKPVPAWQLRERMKHQPNSVPFSGGASTHSTSSLSSTRSMKSSGELDPTLPPAFRTAFARQKKEDDFLSLDSVHSSKTQASMTTARSTFNDSDSFDDSSTFDGHDSFASLGEDDDEDDEAYREQRNMLARQNLENSGKHRKTGVLKSQDFRLRRNGFEGTTLDFIAE